jgi:TPR repeat protein
MQKYAQKHNRTRYLRTAIAVFIAVATHCAVHVAWAQPVRVDSLRTQAQGGSVPAMLLLSEYYHMGNNGTAANMDSSTHYARLAAAQGNAAGQYLYGAALVRSQGIKRDLKQGLQYLNQAADQHNILALRMLTDIYSDTLQNIFAEPAQHVPPNLKTALAYANRGTALGDWQSTLYVGWAHRFGKGTPANDSLALHYLHAAATTHNNVTAQLLLGDFFLYGTARYGINLKRAQTYYEMAAAHKYAEIEDVTWGKVGLHNIRQMPRQLFNAVTRLSPFVPPTVLDVRFKK